MQIAEKIITNKQEIGVFGVALKQIIQNLTYTYVHVHIY